MAKLNVAQFAKELGLPVDLLVEQLKAAGITKHQETDPISEPDKSQLLEHLRSQHGSSKNKISLVRNKNTVTKKADSAGRSRTIQVEVRNKRVSFNSTKNHLVLEGLFENSILGAFRIIRGFANLQDLAEISVPYIMEDGDDVAQVIGQQRKLDERHADSIKCYLESGEQRFLPEVILSVRTGLSGELDQWQRTVGVKSKSDDDGIFIQRKGKDSDNRIHQIIIDRQKLGDILENKLIRRLDGNHRLARASQLQIDPHLPTKYRAPFCIVLLEPPSEKADDYSESLIFHTINSTALPLESEHALKLILGQHSDFDMSAEQEFAFSPELHFTRLLRNGLLKLPEPVQARLGNHPLTSLRGAVRGLLDMDQAVAINLSRLKKYSKELLAAINDIVTRMEPDQPLFCKSEFFIELVARVWKDTPDDGTHDERVHAAVAYLEQLAAWLGKDGLVGLKESQSLSKQVLDIYKAVRTRIPKKVFLARWYPTATDGEEFNNAKLRLKHIRLALKEIENEEGVHLELVDMGTQTGSTLPIHAKMYDAIMSADIILIDLTGVRPNVCVEAGYALRNHEKNRLIFIFQPNDDHKAVPFDLNTFRYELFKDTGAIPEKIKPHISAILRGAAIGS